MFRFGVVLFSVTSLSHIPSWIIKFILIAFTTQSLCYPQIVYFTAVKTVVVSRVYLVSVFSIRHAIMAFVGRLGVFTENETAQVTNWRKLTGTVNPVKTNRICVI